MNKTLITAHNGADGTPEDSMEYVLYALSTDADVMEIDIRPLPDGTLVFTHDVPVFSPVPAGSSPAEADTESRADIPPASSTAGSRADIPPASSTAGSRAGASPASSAAGRRTAVSELTQLQGPEPVSVESVFRRVYGTGKLVNCDLKEAGLESAVYDLAKRCGIDRQLIYSGTVSAEYCRKTGLTRLVRIALNIEEYVPDLYARCRRDPAQIMEAAKEMSAVCHRYGIECVNANYRLATDAFLDTLEKNRLTLSAWTVDDLTEASRFLQRGIQGGIENVTTRNLRQVLSMAGRQVRK